MKKKRKKVAVFPLIQCLLPINRILWAQDKNDGTFTAQINFKARQNQENNDGCKLDLSASGKLIALKYVF